MLLRYILMATMLSTIISCGSADFENSQALGGEIEVEQATQLEEMQGETYMIDESDLVAEKFILLACGEFTSSGEPAQYLEEFEVPDGFYRHYNTGWIKIAYEGDIGSRDEVRISEYECSPES